MITAAGLDPGLTALGYADTLGNLTTIKPKSRGGDRLVDIENALARLILPARPDFVLIEGYAFGSKQQAHQLGEAGGIIRGLLTRKRIPYDVVPPATLKKFLTGNGNANKERMIAECILRMTHVEDDHQADALALHWLANEALGNETPMHGLRTGIVNELRERLPRQLWPSITGKV